MDVANVNLGLWIWQFLENEQMKSINFLQAGRNPIFLGGGGYGKWMWLIYKPDADL